MVTRRWQFVPLPPWGYASAVLPSDTESRGTSFGNIVDTDPANSCGDTENIMWPDEIRQMSWRRADAARKPAPESADAGRQWANAVIDTAAPFLPEALRRHARVTKASTGKVLFGCGEAADDFYCVLKGHVSVRRSASGAEGDLLQCAVSGDWIMEPQTSGRLAGVWAVCERSTFLLVVPARAFNDCLDDDPRFARAWCAELGRQMARLQRQVERLRMPQASDRIAHYLATENSEAHREMVLPYPKCVLAAHLGVAPETLSRALGAMEAQGRIECLPGNRLRLVAPPLAQAA